MIRRHPEAKARLSPRDVTALAATQATLLDSAAARVAPGGTLVYAVCTFTRAEGPDQLAAFLARHPDFTVAPPPAALARFADASGALRTWPHRDGADGFFIVRLSRGIILS